MLLTQERTDQQSFRATLPSFCSVIFPANDCLRETLANAGLAAQDSDAYSEGLSHSASMGRSLWDGKPSYPPPNRAHTYSIPASTPSDSAAVGTKIEHRGAIDKGFLLGIGAWVDHFRNYSPFAYQKTLQNTFNSDDEPMTRTVKSEPLVANEDVPHGRPVITNVQCQEMVDDALDVGMENSSSNSSSEEFGASIGLRGEQIIDRPKRFFQVGRIFKTVWFEPGGDNPPGRKADLECTTNSAKYDGGKPIAKYRWFVVVRKRLHHSLCFNITSIRMTAGKKKSKCSDPIKPLDFIGLPGDYITRDQLLTHRDIRERFYDGKRDDDKHCFNSDSIGTGRTAASNTGRGYSRTSSGIHLVMGITQRQGTLSKLLRLCLPLSLAQLVCAAGPPIAYRTPKIVTLGISAMGSLGSGMTSLQFSDPDDPKGTQLAKICLRISCSACLLALTVGYTLWFLQCPLKKRVFIYQYAQKKQSFLLGFGICSLLCWLFVKLASSATDEPFLWIDKINLFGLLSVITGVLNAESSLVGGGNHEREESRSVELDNRRDRGAGSEDDADDSLGRNGGSLRHRHPDDEESQVNLHREETSRSRFETADIGLSILSSGSNLLGGIS